MIALAPPLAARFQRPRRAQAGGMSVKIRRIMPDAPANNNRESHPVDRRERLRQESHMIGSQDAIFHA